MGKCRKYKIGIGEIKMNNEQRKKLKILKYANEENIKKIQWKNNILLQECLNNLETYQIIFNPFIVADKRQIFDNFTPGDYNYTHYFHCYQQHCIRTAGIDMPLVK